MANTQAVQVAAVDPKDRRFVKVVANEIVETEIPESGVLPDGRQVSAFDKLPDAALKSLGWVPVADPGPPVVNEETQVVEQELVVAPTGDVAAVYTVVELPPSPDPADVVAMTDEQLNNLFALLVAKGVITQAEWDEARKPKPPA